MSDYIKEAWDKGVSLVIAYPKTTLALLVAFAAIVVLF